MSIVVGVVLGCTALASIVAARVAFRQAVSDGASSPLAWGAAGTSAVSMVTVVCTEVGILDPAQGVPSGSRIAAAVVAVVVAAFFAYVAYDVTGPMPAPAGGAPIMGLSKPKRRAFAAAAATGTYLIIAVVQPLLG
ncbi:hypothetical protein OHT59_24005 [Streptomyces sp. NBC_00243]|uniref:hypothetical protein n=1 Tax=Streptomyces sp. NBC_00243 TaxID=2975688 RepID=UPI002DD857BD|nr:hypothetical protein [Streptomyces sp. NBC_00243]WRZ21349.1 hypothetical protein OHT59_24005 [Streptomyces sp. NBC_00243]